MVNHNRYGSLLKENAETSIMILLKKLPNESGYLFSFVYKKEVVF